MKHFQLILLLMQVILQLSDGQFPSMCMETASLDEKKCCPLFEDHGECGSALGRGECTIITLSNGGSSVRDRWPYYFNRVCVCASNYSGYDCSRCKYGHYGENCEYSKVIERKSISKYSPKEWKEYLEIINDTKQFKSGYKVFLTESQGHTISSEITLYNLFVWQHHYPAKDNEHKGQEVDYAHESTGFLTWHRQFLLWFEWEIQYMLKILQGKDDYYNFRIPYWDWRKEIQDENNSPFQSNRLGESSTDNNGLPKVTGTIFKDWQTICWSKNGNSFGICDPDKPTGQLQRCPLNSCTSDNALWPNDSSVQQVIAVGKYDNSPYNSYSLDSFRNQLEGFELLPQKDRQVCRKSKLCMCEEGNFNCTGDNNEKPLLRLLHNSIHIILGIGYFGSAAFYDQTTSGVMADVAASANDPIFLNHHAMVDCIFETWLQKNPNAKYPTASEIPSGHRKQDYIVPFFPLYKHEDMLSTADKFGYKCEIKPHKPPWPWWAYFIIGVIILLLLLCIIIVPVKIVCYIKKKGERSKSGSSPSTLAENKLTGTNQVPTSATLSLKQLNKGDIDEKTPLVDEN